MVTVRRLVWDNFNGPHVARHNVTPDEVEEVCHGDHIVRQAYRLRIMLIGPTATGRMLAVVLNPEGQGVYYPVTARPASQRERQLYNEEKRGATS